MERKCRLYDEKECTECGECSRCDLEPKKICNNCMRCVKHTTADYAAIEIDDIIESETEDDER